MTKEKMREQALLEVNRLVMNMFSTVEAIEDVNAEKLDHHPEIMRVAAEITALLHNLNGITRINSP